MVVVMPMMTAVMPMVKIEIVMMMSVVMASMMAYDQMGGFWWRWGR